MLTNQFLNNAFNTTFGEVDRKIPDVSGLIQLFHDT